MDIRRLGRFGFEVRSSAGMLVIDPDKSVLAGGLDDPNTVVAFSRKDRVVKGLPSTVKVITGPGEYEISGLSVRGVATPAADPAVSHEINTSYVADADGLTVCSTGPMGAVPDRQTMQETGSVDVLLVDAEAGELEPAEVATAIRNYEPKVVVPTGYDSEAGKPSDALARVLGELGVQAAEPQSRLTLSRSSIPEERATVILSPRD